MSVASSKVKLNAATRNLKIKWSEVKQKWNDPASRAFEKNHLRVFERQVRSAMNALDTMRETMHTMQKECSEE